MLNCHLLEVDRIRVGVKELLRGRLTCKLEMFQDPGKELLELLLPLDDELPVWGEFVQI